jgi:hypothetical protein
MAVLTGIAVIANNRGEIGKRCAFYRIRKPLWRPANIARAKVPSQRNP